MELTNGERAAIDKVLALFKERGNEHVVILRDDKEIRVIHGNAESVSLSDAIDKGDLKEGDTLIHNHPGLNSLSNVDIGMGARNGLKAVFAVATKDQSVYKATMNRKGPLQAALLWLSQESIFRMLLSEEVMQVASELDMQRDPSDPSGFNEAHWINLRMAKDGWFDYEYQLGDVTQKIVDGLDSRLNKGGKLWWMV